MRELGLEDIVQIIEKYRDKMKRLSNEKYYIGIGDHDYWRDRWEVCNDLLKEIEAERSRIRS